MTESNRFIHTPRVLGVALIFIGALALAGQIFDFDLGRFLWPFFIIVPGALVFISALTGSGDEGLAITGSILTVLGTLFLYQSIFDHWESWAYAWALVGPTAVGLGQTVFGTVKGRPATVTAGWDVLKVGLIMFVIGFAFFELLINVSGFNLGLTGWAVLFIALGVFVLVRALLPEHKG